jgi:hypothetical protein
VARIKEKNVFSKTFLKSKRPVAFFHWGMGVGVLGLMGTAYVAGQIENDPAKTPPEKLKLRQKLM